MHRSLLSMLCLVWLGLADVGPATAAPPDHCALLSQVSDADPDKDPRIGSMTRQDICLAYFWIEGSFSPAEALLSSPDFTAYKQALERNACETALQLVREAFIAEYPSAPSIKENKAVFESWRNNALGIHYPDVAICLERKEFSKLQKQITVDRLVSEPYRGLTTTLTPQLVPLYPDPVFRRHAFIFGWESRVGRIGHAPTALTLLKLSRSGQTVRYHSTTEFYLASLLKVAGQSDPVIEEVLALPLSPVERAKVEQALLTNSFKSVINYAPRQP